MYSKNNVVYKCKQCKCPLFQQINTVYHTPNINAELSHETKCIQKLFIEPPCRFRTTVCDEVMNCPSCNANIGTFTWNPKRCSCLRWVTPAFEIDKDCVMIHCDD